MENQDLRAAPFSDHLADDARVRLISDLTFFARDRDHRELELPFAPRPDFLHSNHIARRHPVLLPSGADNRVHTSASVKCRLKPARQWIRNGLTKRIPRAHTSAAQGP